MTGPARPASSLKLKTLVSLTALLAAVAAIVVVVVTHRNAPAIPSGNTKNPTFTGRTWFVISVRTSHTTSVVTPHTPAAQARVAFERSGSFQANDGVNALFGHYRRTSTGYRTVGDTGSTAIGYVGADRTLLAVQAAMNDALAGTTTVKADVHASRLTLRFGATTITLRPAQTVTGTGTPSDQSSSAVVPASGTASK